MIRQPLDTSKNGSSIPPACVVLKERRMEQQWVRKKKSVCICLAIQKSPS
jgi:hypothetical protein